jgi:hypothetical protein
MIQGKQLARAIRAANLDKTPNRAFDEIATAFREGHVTCTDFSIRDIMEHLVPGGREIVDSWNPRHGGVGISLTEAGDAVNTAAFANISGQIVYNAIMEAFTMESFVFSQAVRHIPTQFTGEKIAGIGRIGDQAEVVGEGMPFPNVGVSEDYIETPVTTKRGMIVPLTKEAIFFDRTGVLIQTCAEVGENLALNKEKRVIDLIIDENVTAHRYKWRGTVYATYQTSTPWDNTTASAALTDWTDIDEAEQTLAGILDPNTGEPVMNMPKDLIVTRQNLKKAQYIQNATEIRVGDGASATTQTIAMNPLSGSSYRILSSQLLAARMGTDTTWYLGDVRKAFAYMENWPLTAVQAPPNSEDEFTRDIAMKWKASERGATATLEPRVMTKCTVA